MRRSRTLACLALLVPLLAGCDPDGEVQEITDQSIYGWACDLDQPTTPIGVHIYATNAPAAPGGGCFPEGPDTYCFVAAGAADQGNDPILQRRCGSAGRQFNIATPAVLKNGQHHKVIAFGINVGDGQNARLRGQPFDFPSTIIRQGMIYQMDEHILVENQLRTTPGCPQNPPSAACYPNPVGHTYLAYYGMGPHVVDTPTSSLFAASVTGFLPAVPIETLQAFQRERNHGYGPNSLQAFGDTVGAYLARSNYPVPNFPQGHTTAGLVISQAPKTPRRIWQGAPLRKLRFEGYFRVPHVFTVSPGLNILYATLVFRDLSGRDLWFGPMIYQNPLLGPRAGWDDPGGGAPLIPAAATPIGSGSQWVTSCGASSSDIPFSDERYFCFEISGTQWAQLVQAVNSDPERLAVLSTNPADWAFSYFNVNAESWTVTCTPTCTLGDAHMGFSVRGFKVSQIN